MTRIPKTFPLVAFDKVLLGFRALGDMVIHAELEFAHRLDAERLERAFDLILDAEPILGCRWVAGRGPFGRAHWERLGSGERKNFEVVSSEAAYETFLVQAPGAEVGPQIRCALLPGARDGEPDRIAVTITHDAGDAGALKEAVARIAEIYTRLGSEPRYAPEPNLRGSRGIRQVVRQLRIVHFPRIYLNYLKSQARSLTARTGPRLGWTAGREGRPVYVVRHLSAGRVARLSAYGHARGATLNDIVVAAGMRAFASLAANRPRAPFQLITTADLRRHYLPTGRAEAICNLSAIEPIVVDAPPGTSPASMTFEEMVRGVVKETRARKANWIGLTDLIGTGLSLAILPASWVAAIFGALMRAAGRKEIAMNCLTNMGPIATDGTAFDRPANRAWLRVPPMYPLRLAIGLTGYSGSLTLSAATFVPGGSPADIERLFDRIWQELPE